ncbi:TraB/GumN family protein [Bacillus pinisoli]|uniref:TraB/GumN family protein n=1 Tax=Bacillus pinisoli TaxID=2901866 RepID=UPI001FF50C14|nr:TraB/GumN family protein [Bacillus pinisoli]
MSTDTITRLTINEKEIILIGTAHVSRYSAEEVKEVIESERPDTVCIELDQQRYQSLTDENKWKEMDLFDVIKKRKTTLLLMNLVISSFQKRIASQLGIKAGQEMIQGIDSAKEVGAELVLADRNIQVTFSRIWNGLGFMGKAKLLSALVGSIFNKEEITEEELEKLKKEDMLQSILQEFTQAFPGLKKTLIDERDQYLSQKIKDAPGEKIVAIVGAAHVPGIKKEINKEHDLKSLNKVPNKKKKPKWVGWIIPAIIIALIGYTLYENPSAGFQQTLSWILWNGTFAALGAAIALAHPLAVLTAFIIAPISSLNPLMAAGVFSGLVHVYFRRPKVTDFVKLSEDVYTVKGFWKNKVSRVLLIVLLTNLGSAIGTFIGGADIIRVFLENL